MTAGEIVERFAEMMSQPAISKHLSVLENAGLVWREKRGQSIHYELKEDALTGTLAHFLAEVCPRTRPLRKALQRPPTQEGSAIRMMAPGLLLACLVEFIGTRS